MPYNAALDLFTQALALQRAGQIDDCIEKYNALISLRPDFVEAYNNLGAALKDKRLFDDELKQYQKALSINPKYADAHNNLGNALNRIGKIDQALQHYEKAYALDPRSSTCANNLLAAFICLGRNDEALSLIQKAVLGIDEDGYSQIVLVAYCLIVYWLQGKIEECRNLRNTHPGLANMQATVRTAILLRYIRFMYLLCDLEKPRREEREPIYVVGESHVLPCANTFINFGDKKCIGTPHLVQGVKMWHLATDQNNLYKKYLQRRLEKIPSDQNILVTIGEIDCRPDEGIWDVFKKGQRPLEDIIKDTVSGYVAWLETNLEANKPASITLQGIPYPGYALEGSNDPGDKDIFLGMIAAVNKQLEEEIFQRGWNFLDVYSATRGNKRWHIDDYHLKPEIYSVINIKTPATAVA